MANHGTELKACSKKQLIQVQGEVALALENISTSTATRILGDKGQFRELMQRMVREHFGRPLGYSNHLSFLKQFFSELFGIQLDVESLDFPVLFGFQSFMVVPQHLSEDQIMAAYLSKFDLQYLRNHMEPVAKSIDRTKEQPRPQGLYTFAHRGGIKADERYLNKSGGNIPVGTFMNAKEYLLVTGFHRFVEGKFMDSDGWTRTSSIWTDRNIVSGYSSLGNVFLGDTNLSRRSFGFREIVLS